MPAANGFVTVTPDTRYGAAVESGTANWCYAQKFTVPVGTWEVTEIGGYFNADVGTSGWFHLGIFGDDAVNGCPSTLVADSDSGALSRDLPAVDKVNHAYSVTPQVSGGDYWLVVFWADGNLNISSDAVGGTECSNNLATYPTWPTDTQWHSHFDGTYDLSLYAVYQSTTIGSKIMLGSMINIG